MVIRQTSPVALSDSKDRTPLLLQVLPSSSPRWRSGKNDIEVSKVVGTRVSVSVLGLDIRVVTPDAGKDVGTGGGVETRSV